MLGTSDNRVATRVPDAGVTGANLLDGLEIDGIVEGPATGSRLGPAATLHHDADAPALGLAMRPGGLRITTYQFAGTYLSLALDLPVQIRDALAPGCRLTVDLDATASRRLTVFLRLNLQGPRGMSVLHELAVLRQGTRRVRFDIPADFEPVDAAWLDIILSHPRMSEAVLSGVHVTVEGP